MDGRFSPVSITFHRTKYGRELLVDAAFVSRLPNFDRTRTPHFLDFFDILLVTRGQGRFLLDGTPYPVRPGTVFFSRPGEVRQWEVRDLDGACLFFTPDFLTEAFADPRLLDLFSCFRSGRPSAALPLERAERESFLGRFHEMEREIAEARPDSPHALRALLYQLLVLLTRWYAREYGKADGTGLPALIERFRGLVEAEFAREHSVAAYARRLHVTPGYLNARCRAALGESAGQLIRRRVSLEARRLLLYSDLAVAEIGRRLGFRDAAYFARFFRRTAGAAPRAFRGASAPPATYSRRRSQTRYTASPGA